jgi:hypothetical protein
VKVGWRDAAPYTVIDPVSFAVAEADGVGRDDGDEHAAIPATTARLTTSVPRIRMRLPMIFSL